MAFGKRSPYRNKKCSLDGIDFDSLMERNYYRDVLKPGKAGGSIRDFRRPAPTLMLDFAGYALGSYTPDFLIVERDGSETLVETKGRQAPDFRLRWLLARVLYQDRYAFLFVGEKEPQLRLVPAKRTRKDYVVPDDLAA